MAPYNMEDRESTWAKQNSQGGSSSSKGGLSRPLPPLATGLLTLPQNRPPGFPSWGKKLFNMGRKIDLPKNFRPAFQRKGKNKIMDGNDKAHDPKQDPAVIKFFPIYSP